MTIGEHDPIQPPPREPVRDRRVKPSGVLPRRLQTWAMLAVAAGVLLVIFVTGRQPAPKRPSDGLSASSAASALPPDRLRRYQAQLTEQEARLRQELAEAQAAGAAPPPSADPAVRIAAQAAGAGQAAHGDPLADEQRRREYTSLFADTVAFTRRSAGSAPPAATGARSRSDADAALTDALTRAAIAAGSPPSPAQPVISSPASPPSSPVPASAPGHATAPPTAHTRSQSVPNSSSPTALVEGTIIEAVLTNRLDGSFANPVSALVTTAVYGADRETVVIPAGARVLGGASPVQEFGETRLAVTFHRLVMPDGLTYDLDQFPGLNERGDAGLADTVDRHYVQIFGASIALGALSGLAQYSTRSGANGQYGFSDAFGQGMGGSLAASSGRVLDRFLNVLPGVTIREGHRLRIYLTRDLDLPPYREPSAR
jgi:type IV secretion system protein VirB10